MRYLIYLVILFLVACENESNYSNFVLQNTREAFIIGMDRPVGDYFYSFVSTFNNKDTSFVYYYCRTDSSVRIITKNNERVYQLDSIVKNIKYHPKMGVRIHFVSPDLFLLDSSIGDSIYEISLKDLKTTNTIALTLNKKDVYLRDFIEQDINLEKNNYILGIYGETNSAFASFKLDSNQFILKQPIDELPKDYLTNDMYIEAGMLTRISKDSLIVSYYYSDTASLIVNNTLVKKIALKSDSSKEFKGFSGNDNDMNSISQYFLLNQRYGKLFYDNDNKLFYRFFYPEGKIINGKNQQNNTLTISVFNNSFKKIHEEILNAEEHYKGFVFMFNNELYINNVKKSIFNGGRDSSTICMEKYELKKIK